MWSLPERALGDPKGSPPTGDLFCKNNKIMANKNNKNLASSRKQIKEDHEKAVCESFLDVYNYQNKTSIKFINLGDPNKKEPDCICSDKLSIEIVSAYDNEHNASKIWAEAQSKINTIPLDVDLRLDENLTNIIDNKLNKLRKGNYENVSGKIFLVCKIQSPLTKDDDVECYINNYQPFKNDSHNKTFFDKIYIIWTGDNSQYKIRKLE